MAAIVAISEDLEIGKKSELMDVEKSEKVELKDVPNGGGDHKSDAEKPVEDNDVKQDETSEKNEKRASKFKNFFSRDKSNDSKVKQSAGSENKTAEVKENGDEVTELLIKDEENGDVHIDEPKKRGRKIKSLKWIKIKKSKSKEQSEPVQFDLGKRDEKDINPEVGVAFEDVFGEPSSAQSMDCNWRAAHCIFTRGRGICYKVLTLPFAIPLAIIWAILFAFATCLQVWCVRPGGLGLKAILGWAAAAWSFIIRSVLDPIFLSVGMCLKQQKTKISAPIIEVA